MLVTITNTALMAKKIGDMIHAEETDPQLPELQRQLAVTFGERYGWQLSERYFALSELGTPRDAPDIRWGIPGAFRPRLIDHPCYYREQQRPVAIAAHLYEGTVSNEEIAAFAASIGVIAAEISDFSSETNQ